MHPKLFSNQWMGLCLAISTTGDSGAQQIAACDIGH